MEFLDRVDSPEVPDGCRLSAYEYELPAELIAQAPSPCRDMSRLLLIDRKSGRIRHHRFREIADLLSPSDLLVMNETRVVPAALHGIKTTGGRVELLVIDPAAPDKRGNPEEPAVRLCMVKSSKPVREGARIVMGPGVELSVEETRDSGRAVVRFPVPETEFGAFLATHGVPPLPPYIKRDGRIKTRDSERYQTIYSRVPGSVAAPTAGLHFTPEVLDALDRRGIESTRILLHVGPGTFTPIREEDTRQHRMEPEYYEIPAAAARTIARAARDHRRIVAVGTTTVRALETAAKIHGEVEPSQGWTDLFITPGYRFQVVGGLVTNFHLPRSTLLMLTCAFGGTEHVLDAYAKATQLGYRFYSYGDVTVIIDVS
ncbi:MAG: tRNA preQ1(34) S-adenosylmethionine ribosyltransferase-isomerase QueA [Thermodesulfobacteriota bacterium]